MNMKTLLIAVAPLLVWGNGKAQTTVGFPSGDGLEITVVWPWMRGREKK